MKKISFLLISLLVFTCFSCLNTNEKKQKNDEDSNASKVDSTNENNEVNNENNKKHNNKGYIMELCLYESEGNIVFNLLKLKENLKSLVETTYYVESKFGEYTKTNIDFQSTLLIGNKGFVIKRNWYSNRNRIDKNNVSIDLYKYNDNGNVIEVNSLYKYIFKYDEKDNVIEICKYHLNGNFIIKYTYKYDNKSNIIERDSYESKCSSDNDPANVYLSYKSIYNYDDINNIIEVKGYDHSGDLDTKYTYKYDSKGNKIEENYKSYSTYYNGSLDYKHTYKYDYDKTGDWIRQTELKNDIPQFFTEREIEYY